MMVMIPFLSRCSVFCYSGNGELGLTTRFGFTGLQALRRVMLHTNKEERICKMFSIDRYFISRGFVPQILFIADNAEHSTETIVQKFPEIQVIHLDGLTNVTPNSEFKVVKSND